MPKKLIIFTDIGDTIINEVTEIRKVRDGIVESADCIPGAKETYLELHRRGYTIAMVADGYAVSFHNTMTQNGLEHIFACKSISDVLGVHKPHALMFQTAMDALRLTEADKHRIIMVGNNAARDVLGAHLFGIRCVLMDWSGRYPKPASACQQPDYVIHTPDALLPLVEELEAAL